MTVIGNDLELATERAVAPSTITSNRPQGYGLDLDGSAGSLSRSKTRHQHQ